MIRTEKGELVCICEECGHEYCGGLEDSFRAFVQDLKESGWKIGKDDDGNWTHTCPECQE